MKEKRIFVKRSGKADSKNVVRKYFLIFEGEETERIYFEKVMENSEKLGIDPLIELVPMLRCYSERGWSNPQKILERVLLNIEEVKNNEIQYKTLVDWIIDELIDLRLIKAGGSLMKRAYSILEETLQSDEAAGTVRINDVEFVAEGMIENLVNKLGVDLMDLAVGGIVDRNAISFVEGVDKICLIIDRDSRRFTREQYDYVLNTCIERGFGFYLSNPCFEFWLLLHFDEVMDLDFAKIKENPKVRTKRRYCEQKLREYSAGYTKGKFNVDYFIDHLDVALKNESYFCEDSELLKNEIGSRVGILIKELLQS